MFHVTRPSCRIISSLTGRSEKEGVPIQTRYNDATGAWLMDRVRRVALPTAIHVAA